MARGTIRTSLPHLAKCIDHALLHPTLADREIRSGLAQARYLDVATVCVKPYSIPQAQKALAGSSVLVCTVIGFPHGSSTTASKVYEATEAIGSGADEIDMVVNVGKVLSGDWNYVAAEIKAVNDAVQEHGGLLKVIFETDYLSAHEDEIVGLCKVCAALNVAFVKTSTGFGFVKQAAGGYDYKGATAAHIKLMKGALDNELNQAVEIKASGGVRSLDDMLYFMSLGATRIGTSSTAALLYEAERRGIGAEPSVVEFEIPVAQEEASGAY